MIELPFSFTFANSHWPYYLARTNAKRPTKLLPTNLSMKLSNLYYSSMVCQLSKVSCSSLAQLSHFELAFLDLLKASYYGFTLGIFEDLVYLRYNWMCSQYSILDPSQTALYNFQQDDHRPALSTTFCLRVHSMKHQANYWYSTLNWMYFAHLHFSLAVCVS